MKILGTASLGSNFTGSYKKKSVAQDQFDNLKNLDSADYNPKGLPMNIDLLIGSHDYWDFIGYKQVRRKSGPNAIFSRLVFVLSGPYVNDQNNANAIIKFNNSHLFSYPRKC